MTGSSDAFAEVNDCFVEWYGEVEDAAVDALPHLLIAISTPDGGAYTLWRGDEAETVHPVRERFSELRAVAHVPLAIYAMDERHAATGDTAALFERGQRLLRGVARLQEIVEAWDDEDHRVVAGSVLARCRVRLEVQFGGDGRPPRFQQPSDAAGFIGMHDDRLDQLLAAAGEIQAHDCGALLARWQTELGEDAWRRLHAVVGTAPAVRGPGTHGVIVRHALGPKAEDEGRLVVFVGLRDVDQLRHRVGTALANRALASAMYDDPHRLEGDLMTGPVTAALDAGGAPPVN